MIKRSQALHSLFTRGTSLSDANGEITMIKIECDVKLIGKIIKESTMSTEKRNA